MPEKPHLAVYLDRSTIFDETGRGVTFREGAPNNSSKRRYRIIRSALENGWLKDFVEKAVSSPSSGLELDENHRRVIDSLVSSVTSQVGRSLVGLSVLQMAIKAIESSQSIRLHKGGHGGFSWTDGIPMRSLDSDFVTPVLREYDLLRLNIYGFMMTRSLAENYPYSRFYKAALRGGKNEWLEIVEALESGKLEPRAGLSYLISILSNRSKQFKELADQTIGLMKSYIQSKPPFVEIFHLIYAHMRDSTYQARLLEVAMHSLLQVAEDIGAIEGLLLPLCQMRTANKKHRNIGDVEIVASPISKRVVEAWDAKFGKPYLRDELDELDEKLDVNESVVITGFVVESEPTLTSDISDRIKEIETEHGVVIKLLSFASWVRHWIERMEKNDDYIFPLWLEAYVESLCHKRRDRAPIDEPSEKWVKDLHGILETQLRERT